MNLELSSKRNHFISSYLLGFSALLFLAFYLVQSIYIRPVYDDVLFFSSVKDKGIIDSLQYIYLNWSGRFTGYAYFFSLLNLSNTIQSVHYFASLYYCVTIVILIYSVVSIVQYITNKLFQSKINTSAIIVFSILFIASFYFFTFQNIEVWGWICGTIFYLQGIAFLLFGLALLLKENKNLIHYILISLSFIYVGGSNEIYSLTACCLLITVIVYFIYNKKISFQSITHNKLFKGIIGALFSIIISSAISFSAPGNQLRNKQETTVAASGSTDTTIFTISSLFTQKKYYAAIGMSSLWLILGMKIKRNTSNYLDKTKIKKLILISFLPFILSIIVIILFKTFIVHNQLIPQRAYTFTSFTLAGFCCFSFLLIGYAIPSTYSFLNFITMIILPFIIVIFLSLNLYKQYNYANNYANQYDIMLDTLVKEKNNNRTNPLLINDFPDAGTLLKFDLEDDYYTMNPLKKILGIKYEIKVIK